MKMTSNKMTSNKMTSNLHHWLIRNAARGAPVALAARLEEEWLADLAARPGYFSRLRFALGCCWATQVITFENRPARGSVVSATVGARGIIALPDAFARVSRRSSTFVLVLSLHAALFYLVVTTVTRTHHEATAPPLQNQVLNISRPVEPKMDEQPKRDVTFELPPLTPPPPPSGLIVDQEPPVEDTSQSGDGLDVAQEPQTPVFLQPPSHVPSTIQGGPGAGFPNPDDFYPAPAKRLNEEGSATVQVCVDAKGRLISTPVTMQSSGSTRLDQGAIKLATSASGHYRATTEDGRPVSACYPLRIRFRIKD